MTQEFLDRWHKMVANRDLDELDALLADDATIGAPPYWNKMEGKPTLKRLLTIIIQTIEDFTYHREWVQEKELALEFRGNIGGNELQGIDLITLNDEGRLQNLDVMIRPMNTLEILAGKVREKMLAR